MQKEKVVIIGAGPAGLCAAYKLLSESDKYDVTILEEDKQVGGISKTIKYKNNRMDLGGHRFFSKNETVNQFWTDMMPIQGHPAVDDFLLKRKKELNIGGPNPETNKNTMLKRQRVSRIYYNRHFFDYPVSLKMDTLKNMGFANTVKVGCGYLKSCIAKKPEDNLENFYINRFGRPLYGMFFEDYTEKLWGRHPSDISADWGSQRVKGLSITALLKNMMHKGEKETSLIEEFLYPALGPGQLWEEVAEKVTEMGGKIYINCAVTDIVKENGKIKKVICESFKEVNGIQERKEYEFEGDIFISSMPLKDLVVDMNDVPENIHAIANGLPYRDFVTLGVLVDKIKLKNTTNMKTINNIIPDCWLYIQEPDVKMGRIQVFNNWSPYLVKDMNKVWMGLEYFCNENDDFWNMSDEEMKEFAINELLKIGVIDGAKDVLDTHRVRVKKAYPAYFDTYDNIDEVIKYLNNIDNLYCIGRNGQHRYNNMDHSMLTGFYAAEEIINNTNNKNRVWSVNTEKEYHEEK